MKALGEQARFIVKFFRYQRKLSAKSAELGFYIIKLAKATGFSFRYLHIVTY